MKSVHMIAILTLLSGIVSMVFSSPAIAQVDVEAMTKINSNMLPPLEIVPEKVEAAGIRVIAGKHLFLYTDIRETEGIDELAQVFDLAVPQWCEMFGVNPKKAEPWRLTAFLMNDREPFKVAGLFPDDLPRFPTGFNRGYHFWVFRQPGKYYTRHLLLHEGTHAFMQWFLKGSGPAWYSEGMAEKIGLHEWKDGTLQLSARVTRGQDCEYWGRPKFIATARDEKKVPRLDEVFDLSAISFQDIGSYAWSWAACEFLGRHPLTEEMFSRLASQADNVTPTFSSRFKTRLEKHWAVIECDWQLFVAELTYGVQSDRTSISAAVAKKTEGIQQFTIRADHSWQETEKKVAQGEKVSVSAFGRFVVMTSDVEVPCEAGGITLRYYRGHPLGKLMVAILKDDRTISDSIPVGLGETFEASASGKLIFRVNESPAGLFDNSGELTVEIDPAK